MIENQPVIIEGPICNAYPVCPFEFCQSSRIIGRLSETMLNRCLLKKAIHKNVIFTPYGFTYL